MPGPHLSARPNPVPGPAVLTVDIGSSSVRAAVVDGEGRTLPGSASSAEHSLRHSPDGGAELDPVEVLGRVEQVVEGTLASARAERVPIEAVAMDTLWHSVCGVDAAGRPTFPLLTWAERRPAAAAAALRATLDEPAVHARTGARLHPGYWPAKLRWLAEARPEQLAATRALLGPGEYVHTALFGEASTSLSMASGTGLLDGAGQRWDAELLGVLPVRPGQLPAVSDAPARGLRPPYARRWPELRDVPWYPAIGDGAASNLGCGCVDDSRLAVMVGTSGALRVVREQDVPGLPLGLWRYRVDGRRRVVGGALSDGGNLVAWLRRVTALPDAEEVERALAARAPGAHGLTVLPLLAGERSPGWADRATGAITGLTHSTTPLDLLQAALEAVALRFALVAGILHAALPRDRQVVATGAALERSPGWRRVLADALGVPVALSAASEASARGVALLTLERLGAIPELAARPAPLGQVTEPDPGRHDRYRELLEEQVRLYEALYDG